MLGLRALFSALSRLTAAISRSAELFESANGQLERQLGLEPEPPAIGHAEVIEQATSPETNGTAKGRKSRASVA